MELITDPRKKAGETKRSLSRAALLLSADDVFATRSYDEVTVEDISNASNRRPKTFYTIFNNKAHWASTVVDSYFTSRSSSLGQSVNKLVEVNSLYPAILKSVTELRLNDMEYEEILPDTYQDINRNIRFGQWRGEYIKAREPREYGAFILDTLCVLGGETEDALAQRAALAIESICLRPSS